MARPPCWADWFVLLAAVWPVVMLDCGEGVGSCCRRLLCRERLHCAYGTLVAYGGMNALIGEPGQ
jgi:hypothetical protein